VTKRHQTEMSYPDSEFLAFCESLVSGTPPITGMIDMQMTHAERLLRLAGRRSLAVRLLDRRPQFNTLSAHPGEWLVLIKLARDNLASGSARGESQETTGSDAA
jgi:hypothetical protein